MLVSIGGRIFIIDIEITVERQLTIWFHWIFYVLLLGYSPYRAVVLLLILIAILRFIRDKHEGDNER